MNRKPFISGNRNVRCLLYHFRLHFFFNLNINIEKYPVWVHVR